jgi:hypothetical protein
MRDPRGCADFRPSKPSARRERSLAERFILIMAAVWVLNMVLVAIPGHFSHDELDWMHLFRTHNHGWDFWLADVRNSPFFRPLGAVLISKALRLPLQPFATHALLVFVHGLNCCLLYLLMLRFYPQRALAAALLFAVMPGAAFGTGWIAASFDILSVLFGLAAMNAAIAFWRGHAAAYAGVSTVAFALALLCKETSLVIPAAVLIFFYLDHPRADLSRAGILAAGTGVLVLIYLAARLPALLHLGATGAGGYGFGGFAAIFTNTYSYFGYPFAIDMAEVSDYANRRPFALFAPSAIHLFGPDDMDSLRRPGRDSVRDRLFPGAGAGPHHFKIRDAISVRAFAGDQRRGGADLATRDRLRGSRDRDRRRAHLSRLCGAKGDVRHWRLPDADDCDRRGRAIRA